MLGAGDAYDWQPYFFTDQYDLGMEYVGAGDAATTGSSSAASLDSGEFLAFWLDGDRLLAAMNVNTWDVNPELRRLIGRAVPAGRLADAGVPLSDL